MTCTGSLGSICSTTNAREAAAQRTAGPARMRPKSSRAVVKPDLLFQPDVVERADLARAREDGALYLGAGRKDHLRIGNRDEIGAVVDDLLGDADLFVLHFRIGR